jgi:hypothetical protein
VILDPQGNPVVAEEKRTPSQPRRKRKNARRALMVRHPEMARPGNDNGKQFQPGTNSHDGEVFRRGANLLPFSPKELAVRLMKDDGAIAREVLEDPNPCLRVQVAKSLLRAAADPALSPRVFSVLRDTIDGQPTKTVVQQKERIVHIWPSDRPLSPELAAKFGDGTDATQPPPEGRQQSIAAGRGRQPAQEEDTGPVRTEDGLEEIRPIDLGENMAQGER